MMDAEEKSRGGIVLPNTYDEKTKLAKVLAVGPGMWNQAGTARVPLEVKPGDVVITTKFSGAEIEVKGEKYKVLTENEIAGIFLGGGE